jgi:hypothetical protein
MSETELQAAAGEEVEFRSRRRSWIWGLVAASLVVAVACGVWVALRPKRDPLKVLVAVDVQGQWWDGSKPAAKILDYVAPHLKKLGFVSVDGADVKVVERIEGAAGGIEAAERVKASFVVTGTVKLDFVEDGETKLVELHATGDLQLVYMGDHRGVPLGQIRSWSAAESKDAALNLIDRSLGEQTFDLLMPGLMAHASIQSIVHGSDALAAGQLTAARTYLDKRESQLKFAQESYLGVKEQMRSKDKSPHRITLHGSFDRKVLLCALGPTGFLAMASQSRPFYDPDHEQLDSFQELDKLYWQNVDGQTRSLFTGYNIAGYPSASPDGSTVVYVEDRFGSATFVHVVRGTEPDRRLTTPATWRFSEPKVEAHGRLAALWVRCPKCAPTVAVLNANNGKLSFRNEPALVVLDLNDGKVLFRTDPNVNKLGGFAWLGPSVLGFLTRPIEAQKVVENASNEADEAPPTHAPAQTFDVVDFGKTPIAPVVAATVADSAQLAYPSASASGDRVIFSRYAETGPRVALFEKGAKRLQLPEVLEAEDPVLSPGGEQIAYVRHGKIAVYDIRRQTETELTSTGSDFQLRYPQFSLDAKTVYFEIRTKDPVLRGRRIVASVASVPMP